jgi:transcriptional regulator with PAS, ATPase and Fis domain
MDGGMCETIKKIGIKDNVHLCPVCSLESFDLAIESLAKDQLKNPVFVEALACLGGCMHGPCIATKMSDVNNISRIMRHLRNRDNIPQKADTIVCEKYTPAPVLEKTYTMDEIRKALNKIGKYRPEDELNCAGCGYQTCKDMAKALLNGNAEPSMCVSYMRKMATKKANAMLKSIPSAMVMLDKQLNILETNEAFVKMFVEEDKELYLANPQKLIGQPIQLFFEAEKLFSSVLNSGQEIQKENYRFKNKCYELHVFSVEPTVSIGAVITDMTNANHSREMVAKKAKEVIDKNISTVQQIACLLGEHMVQTETILNTIASEYNQGQE